VIYVSVVIQLRQKCLFRVQNWDKSSSSSCDFLFHREKEATSSICVVPAASASTPIVVPATIRSHVHRLCHRFYCCCTREVANFTWESPLVCGFFMLSYAFFFWTSWLWHPICLLWLRVLNVDVCVKVTIWLTVVRSWVVSRFSFRYGGEERLFYVTGRMNEGVVKLLWRDAVVKDGGGDTLATFRV